MQQKTLFRVDYLNHARKASRAYVVVRPTIADDGTGRTVYYATHDRLGCGKNRGTPDAAAIALVNDHGRVIDCARVPGTLADIRRQCSSAYQKAMEDAKRYTGGRGLLRSRGRWVVITANHGDEPLVASECWEWEGTASQLAEVMAYATNPDVSGIYIDGGVDHAACLRDFNDGGYTHWVAAWTVTLFNSDVEVLEVTQ